MTPQRYIPAKRYDTEGATQTDNDRRLTELEDRIPKLSTGKSATWNITRATGGGSGNSQNDQRYLKLTADNDPLTGDLDIKVNAEHALRVLDNTVAVTDAGELWLFEATGIYYTANYSAVSPIWNKVAGSMPDAATLSRGYISKDGTTVYLVYAQSANKGVYKCANPKAATPIWTDILAGQASGIYPYQLTDGNWDCGISGNTLWVFARAVGEDLFYGYHRGEYNGSAWAWSGANWNNPVADYRMAYSWYNGKSFYLSTSGSSAYTLDMQALLSTPAGYRCEQGGKWQMWDFSASLTAMLVKTNDGTKTYLYIPSTDTVLTEITGTYSGSSANGIVNGSLEGNRVFVINTGISKGDIYVGDTTGVTLKANWTYAQRVHDTKLSGGGSLVATVSSCFSGGEVAHISTDGGDTWSDITGNFWSLTTGDKLFYNSGMTYTSGSVTTMFNVDTLTGDTDVVRLIAEQTVQGTRFLSTVATGTSPLSISSTTLNTNLNADLLDGSHSSAFVPITRTIGTTSPLSGGGDLSADRTLSVSKAATASDGYLSSADWNTFNNKQPAGNYITALTGDVTATGPGSATATLATVNSNVGSYGSATQVATFTVNAKGLITAAGNTTISGVTPAAHDIAGALHTTSGRTAGQVLQATGATTFDWSTNTLSISGNSTINGSLVGSMTGSGTVATGGFTLTVPATGTAALLGIANTFTGAPQTFRGTAATVGQEFVTINNDSGSYKWRFVNGGSPTTAILFQGYDSTGAVAFQFSAASGVPTFITPVLLAGRSTDTTNAQLQVQQNGNNPYQNWYTSGGQLAATMYSVGAADASKRAVLDLYNITTATIRLHGNGTSYLNGGSVAIGATSAGAKLDVVGTSDAIQLRATGFTTQGNPVALFIDSTAATNTTREALRLEAKSSGTAAAGFGVKQLFHLQSSTTASQTAAYDEWLWTDATHASRTVLYRGTTTGNATQSGFYGAWAHNAVSNTAITIIPNGTGDVASVGTFVFTVKDNTSATTNGGIVVLNPNGGAISLLSDGTDTLQITCAADGSVTIARSAGTHTFSVSIWGTWQ